MSECIECGSRENIDKHHTSYEPEETVMLCRSCHQSVHGADEHPLKPTDSREKTSIQLPESTRDRLKEERLPHESNYGDTLRRLLNDGTGGQLWTEREIEDMIERKIERQTRR